MVSETGLKLRTKLESAKTLRATAGKDETHKAGDMIMVGDTIGIIVEDVEPGDDFILVYEAEKIVVPKVVIENLGGTFYTGNTVYYDPTRKAVTINPLKIVQNKKCGISLEDTGIHDSEVLIDLMVME